MTYGKGRRRKIRKARVKITREDIEKAMKEFKGEIQYLTIEKDSPDESKPIT